MTTGKPKRSSRDKRPICVIQHVAWRTPVMVGDYGADISLQVVNSAPAISYYGQYSFSEPAGTLRFVRAPQVAFEVNWIALEP